MRIFALFLSCCSRCDTERERERWIVREREREMERKKEKDQTPYLALFVTGFR